jgi:hypothetical protein
MGEVVAGHLQLQQLQQQQRLVLLHAVCCYLRWLLQPQQLQQHYQQVLSLMLHQAI